MSLVIAIAQALMGAIPKIVDLVKKGRDPSEIKLGEVISTDALAKLRSAKDRADDFIANG